MGWLCVCGGGWGGGLFEEFLLLFIFRSFSSTDLHVGASGFSRTPFFLCECKTLITV